MAELRLSEHAIDVAVATLRQKGGEWVSRGRGGDGLGYKDGVFYAIYVEDSDQQDHPFADEAALRKYIAGVDVGSNINRYIITVLEQLGAYASFDVNDLAARADALAEQKRAAMTGPHRWHGVVGEMVGGPPGEVYVEVGPGVCVALSDEVMRELTVEGVTVGGWRGRALEMRGYLHADTPSPGLLSLRVSLRAHLRLL
jgi:hypothetical protein